jgi:HEAT repeat protein
MVVGAFAWMLVLILLRISRDRAAEERRVARGKALQLLARMVVEPTPALEAQLQPFLRRTDVMAELVLEFELLVGGEDRVRIFLKLRELGLDAAFVREFRRAKLGRVYLEALAALGGAAASDALREAVDTAREPAIRVAALYYLIALGEDVGIHSLLDAAVRGLLELSRLFYELVRQATATRPEETIEAFGDRSLPTPLRVMLIDALGVCGDYAALETLIAATAEDLEIRTAALRGLGRMMHPAAEPAIAKALRDPFWLARSAAAEAAGRARLVNLTPLLAELLDDPEWWVRHRAGEALAALGDAGREALCETAGAGATLAGRTAEAALAEHVAA